MYRNGHWFASLVFGAVILGALPFYIQSTPCHRIASHGHGALSCSGVVAAGGAGFSLFGRAFEPALNGSLGSWSTLYWVAAIMVGFAAVIAYYHLRARKLGVQGRLWPAVVSGLVILGLLMYANDVFLLPGDFSIRGTSVLVVIAVGLLVLSALERSRPFVVFSLGFLGLAFLGSLYNVSNLFTRLGIGGPFRYGGESLPNLILPGAYLVVGGLIFFLARGWRIDLDVRLARQAT